MIQKEIKKDTSGNRDQIQRLIKEVQVKTLSSKHQEIKMKIRTKWDFKELTHSI